MENKFVTAHVIGSDRKSIDLEDGMTVGEVAEELGVSSGYKATVDGVSASFDDELAHNSYITFQKDVKGGNK